jgi:magnesium chelatase family protein
MPMFGGLQCPFLMAGVLRRRNQRSCIHAVAWALGRAFSVAVLGLDGQIVEIEADITSGLPGVHLVGLPDVALQESRDRVRAAITNCDNKWPMSRLTLALSPATLPKMGSVYDLSKSQAALS